MVREQISGRKVRENMSTNKYRKHFCTVYSYSAKPLSMTFEKSRQSGEVPSDWNDDYTTSKGLFSVRFIVKSRKWTLNITNLAKQWLWISISISLSHEWQ